MAPEPISDFLSGSDKNFLNLLKLLFTESFCLINSGSELASGSSGSGVEISAGFLETGREFGVLLCFHIYIPVPKRARAPAAYTEAFTSFSFFISLSFF